MRRMFGLLFVLCLFLPTLTCSAEETESTLPQETEAVSTGWELYFGLLHSHSFLSEETEPVEAVFQRAAAMEGLDFFAVTDHSESFDNAADASLAVDAVSQDWAAGKAAAQAVTDGDFVGIFGYEMSWGNGLGHMSTFCTPGFQSWYQDAYAAFRDGLANYYETLSTVPGAIAQFNHPGHIYGDFRDFEYRTDAADRQIALLEVGSPDGLTAYAYYDRALEKLWHVAPTNNDPACRTVVYAHSLTEEGIYDALRNRRVYATEDTDLSVYYSMEGHLIGSRLKKWQLGDDADILVTLSDPTDVIGTVEVIGEGGISLGSQVFETQWATAEFSLPTDQRWYYIRITQPDGDVAVTAPVWVEGEEYAGISAFSSGTPVPVQGQAMDLCLDLYNNEAAQLSVRKIEIFADGTLIQTLTEAHSLWQGNTESIPLSVTCDTVGMTEIRVSVTAELGGASRTYTASLTAGIRMPAMVTSLLVDHTHGSSESYAQLAALAVENNISIQTESAAITAEMLENSSILLIPGPQISFSEDFIGLVREYISYGGSLILTGGAPAESNRLLEALGSTLRFGTDEGKVQYLSNFSTPSPWCANLLPEQLYRCSGSIDRGSGSWIVENALAAEDTGFGGRIFAGSGAWLADEALSEPKNLWAPPSANRTILKNILGSTEITLPLHSIADLRKGTSGEVFRIRGYVTADTFADTLYLQDDTGGIAVTSFTDTGISVGTPMEIVGTIAQQNKNTVLKPISYKVLDAAMHRYLPLDGDFQNLLNNGLHGGDLVRVEGKVVSFRMDETGAVRELVLEKNGQFAAVFIDDGILSASLGYNDLSERVQTGRIFRAIGLVHMREDGVSVVRVRNCDEVVHVPVIQYYWEPAQPDNPRVGDSIGFWILAMLLSAAFLYKIRLCKPHCK